jgi:hypothetical protein
MSFRPPLPRTKMIGSKPLGAPKAGPAPKGKPPVWPVTHGAKPGAPNKSC